MQDWTANDLVLGFASLVLISSLFLPWFTETVKLSGIATLMGRHALVATASGTAAHAYLSFVLSLALLILVVLVRRGLLQRAATRRPGQQLLTGVAGLNFVLVALAFFTKPSGSGPISSLFSPILGQGTLLVSWNYGAMLGLVAAATALAAAVLGLRA